MGFIRERVSNEDAKQYDFEALRNLTYHRNMLELQYSWVIDRERKIFFIHLESGGPEETPRHALYWDGQLLTLRLEWTSEGTPYGKLSTTWSLPYLFIPEDFKRSRQEILTVLKEALIVYKFYAYGGQQVEHSAFFNF